MLSAAVSVYQLEDGPCGTGGHAALLLWVYLHGDRWHPYTWAETQQGNLPIGDAGIQIPMQTGGGCVNVHSSPSLSGPVVACVGPSVTVEPAAPGLAPWHAPVWADQKIWWYVFRSQTQAATTARISTPLGWIDLEYLICGHGPHDLNQACDS